MSEKHLFKRLWQILLDPMDGWLLLFITLIYAMSLLVLYSADEQSIGRLSDKISYTIFAFIIMWLVARASPQMTMHFAPTLYVIGLVMLVAVEWVGTSVNGAQRWLDIYVIRLQPSELMKLAIPMMIAWYFYRVENVRRWYHTAYAVALIVIPVLLVVKQPDLGTACLILLSGFFVLFFAGLSWKVMLSGLALFLLSLPAIWQWYLLDYQKNRILSLLNPAENILGTGYHSHQSMIAVGSGGIFGKGWLHGTQNYLDYIPERTTDFIFAVFSEEFGLLGNLILLVLYLAIILRGLKIASAAPTLYSQLLASTITLCFFLYAFVNIGMVTGILPVVGVPLPLMSYGGTATLMILIGQGLLMSIANQSKYGFLTENAVKSRPISPF